MKKKLALLFDLDGTILNTDTLIFESFKHVFKMYQPKTNLDQETLLSFLGPSLRASFLRFFPEEQIGELIEAYHAFNHRSHEQYASVYPTVRETLKYLKEEGYPMAIVTTKLLVAANVGLDVFDLQSYFDVVVGMDDVTLTKPDPEGIFKALTKLDCQQGIMIGDNVSDIQAGKNAGIYTVGVKWSPKGYQALADLHPDGLIDQMIDLIPIVKSLERKKES